MKPWIFDAGAVIAFLRHEPGGDIVHQLLHDTKHHRYIHATNLCEVYYDFVRLFGVEYARSVLDILAAAGLICSRDMDEEFWHDAGQIKARYRRISLADCYGLSLTRRLKGEFITTDHHEMDLLKQAGTCEIRFIR